MIDHEIVNDLIKLSHRFAKAKVVWSGKQIIYDPPRASLVFKHAGRGLAHFANETAIPPDVGIEETGGRDFQRERPHFIINVAHVTGLPPSQRPVRGCDHGFTIFCQAIPVKSLLGNPPLAQPDLTVAG